MIRKIENTQRDYRYRYVKLSPDFVKLDRRSLEFSLIDDFTKCYWE
ncbi:MAG: hypothetical protein WBM43_14540 [Flavobacteriaceae bacterium]